MEGFIAGAWRSFGRAEIYIGGAWRRLTRIEGYIGGQWRTAATFIQPLTVSVIPPETFGSQTPFKPSIQVVTTNSVTARPSGGLAPYTYSWDGAPDPINPNSATTSFRRTLPPETSQTRTYHVTVTDSLGNVATDSAGASFDNHSEL